MGNEDACFQIKFQLSLDVCLCLFFQIVCTVIAALLQYFFIAMFCWAVCEGLQLFLTLATGKTKNSSRLKYFYIIGWSKLTINLRKRGYSLFHGALPSFMFVL